MPFIPHTKADVNEMLSAIDVHEINDLFAEIPTSLRTELKTIAEGRAEMEMGRIMAARARADERDLCFIGAGAYEHHIPAAVWDITSRGEFMTAYTPYQAEASQGTLQLLYEYQTMMASLTGMDVSNASNYDGASALAESVLMALRVKRRAKRVLVPQSLHPLYREVLTAILKHHDVVLEDIAYDQATGKTDTNALQTNDDIAAVIIAHPNFFGVLEEVDALTDWAHAHKALAIAVVNPISLALLKEPGAWGENGVDITCGEGQPLGIPMASGGPYFGFLTCKKAHIRQLPGRIVGKTEDATGREGFTLTLQAREQHIRRAKATSNICTNQGLMVTAATIHMSILGHEGLQRVASHSHANTMMLLQAAKKISGVKQCFTQAFFHEAVLQLPVPVQPVLEALREQGIQGGVAVGEWYPELQDCLLVCATETKTQEDLDQFALALESVIKAQTPAASTTNTEVA